MLRYILATLSLCLLALPLSPKAYANEGEGLISSDIEGALPKGLWRDQPRSEIQYLIKKLPPSAPLRSMQVIKRNMLISTYNTSLIKNDISPNAKEDLMILRLEKLIEMGLWEDAFKLYTKAVTTPENNNKLAQIGVTLIMFQKGLSTACLEEKALAPNFPDTPFWEQLDAICSVELGTGKIIGTQFPESTVLQALYSEPDFKIIAANGNTINKLSNLELALLIRKKKIDYSAVELNDQTPPRILKTFLEDPRFPAAKQTDLKTLAFHQNLLPESPNSTNIDNLLVEGKNLDQNDLIEIVSYKLKKGEVIAEEMAQKILDLAAENPENYFYLQILNVTESVGSPFKVTDDQYNQGVQWFSPQKLIKVNLLKSLLDKQAEFSNNPANIYEKQISLTQDSDYVISTGDYPKWLKETIKSHLPGLSLLIILSNVDIDVQAQDAGENPDATTLNKLNSLHTVGLIDQSHLIAREELANLMGM